MSDLEKHSIEQSAFNELLDSRFTVESDAHYRLLQRCIYFEFMYGRDMKQIARFHKLSYGMVQHIIRGYFLSQKRKGI